MTLRQVKKLAKEIDEEDSIATIGLRVCPAGNKQYYAVACRGNRTGISFTIYSPEDWEDRRERLLLFEASDE